MAKTFRLATDPFIGKWYTALDKEKDWEWFVASIMQDNGSVGIAKTHADFFQSSNGKKALKECLDRWLDWKEHKGERVNGADGNKDALLKKHYDDVVELFYNEKVFAKTASLNSNKNFGKYIRPAGHGDRVGTKKGGGAPKGNWKERKGKMSKWAVKSS